MGEEKLNNTNKNQKEMTGLGKFDNNGAGNTEYNR